MPRDDVIFGWDRATMEPTRLAVNEWIRNAGSSGRVEAVQSVELRPRVSGYIDKVNYVEGQEVKKGEVLFTIDARSYQAEYDRAAAELARARTQATLAQREGDGAGAMVLDLASGNVQVAPASDGDAVGLIVTKESAAAAAGGSVLSDFLLAGLIGAGGVGLIAAASNDAGEPAPPVPHATTPPPNPTDPATPPNAPQPPFPTRPPSDLASTLAKAFGLKGYPTISTNGVNTMEYSPSGGVYTGKSKTNCDEAVGKHKSGTVVANSNYKLTIDGTKATLKVATKFFEAGSGEYYVAAYLAEDKAKNKQSSKSGIVEHHHVFRAAFDGAWGKKITKTGANQQEEFDFETTLDASWIKDNLEVVTVIYKKEGSSYKFVNAH